MSEPTKRQLRWAEDEARRSARQAISEAELTSGHAKSQFLTVAAQKLRDARTFGGAANMAELYDEPETNNAD